MTRGHAVLQRGCPGAAGDAVTTSLFISWRTRGWNEPRVLSRGHHLSRPDLGLALAGDAIGSILDYHCAVARKHLIFFLWRPFLRDPQDDMVLELAVKAECHYVITFNTRDFAEIEQFGLAALSPADFLRRIGVI